MALTVPIFTKLALYECHYVELACHDSDSYSPASEPGDWGSIPVQYIWTL